MAAVASPRSPDVGKVRAAEQPVERQGTPIKYWASLGAAVIALQAYIYIRWIASDEFTRTPVGDDPVPHWMKVELHIVEAASLAGLVVAMYYLWIRPWRRERKVTTDGLLVFGFLTLYWQDLLLNYTAPLATYNAEFFNRGSWFGGYPGWVSPNPSFVPEPLLMAGPFYVYGCLGASLLGCVVMRKAKNRWPQMGKLGLMGVAFVFFCVFDFVLEPLVVMPLGWWAYPGSIQSLSVFGGTVHQFPLYGMLLMAGVWTAWSSLRFFKNDKGETVVERGIDRLKVTGKKKTFVRFLAIAGVLNLMWLIYMVPIQFFNMQNDPWPKGFESKSYLTNGLCGPGTEYACGGPDMPINRPHSAHVNPEGELVPAGK